MTDTTGAVTDRYDYVAFGNISRAGTTLNVYLYSGEQNDSNLGLYYLYTEDDPIDKTDPSRRISLSDAVLSSLLTSVLGPVNLLVRFVGGLFTALDIPTFQTLANFDAINPGVEVLSHLSSLNSCQ